MPTRKLVELNGRYGGYMEIDPVQLKRVATDFKKWLMTVDPNNDPFEFIKYDLPLVNAALNGQMELPYQECGPHTRMWGEGLLPSEYIEIAAPFYTTIRGFFDATSGIIEKNGKYYAWAEFEDPDYSENSNH